MFTVYTQTTDALTKEGTSWEDWMRTAKQRAEISRRYNKQKSEVRLESQTIDRTPMNASHSDARTRTRNKFARRQTWREERLQRVTSSRSNYWRQPAPASRNNSKPLVALLTPMLTNTAQQLSSAVERTDVGRPEIRTHRVITCQINFDSTRTIHRLMPRANDAYVVKRGVK